MTAFGSKSGLVYAVLLAAMAVSAITGQARQQPLFSLREATLAAFGTYIVKTEAQNVESLRQGSFLWVDGLPDRDRLAALAKLKAGEVEIRRLSIDSSGGNPTIQGGMIHDWEGIAFIPGVKIDDVLEILQDYDNQAKYYAPDVERSRLESRNGNEFHVFLRFRRHEVITVVLDTEHAVTYYRDSPVQARSRSSATRIAQVEDPGKPSERERPPG